MNPLAPSVCFGAVMHERHGGIVNRFVYRSAFLRLPLATLPTLRVPLLGIDRPNLFWVRSADHGARDGSPLLPWVRALLARHGLAAMCDGEVVLHTMPRVLGYVFNPVSFYYCHDAAGALRAVVAEVNNTFGEHHNYLVHHDDLRPIQPADELRARKIFHVSPFFPTRGEYRFRFSSQGTVHTVTVDLWEDGARRLATRVSGSARPLNAASLGRWLVRQPLATFAVVVRIHWQALRLAVKGADFRRKPQPPLEETSR